AGAPRRAGCSRPSGGGWRPQTGPHPIAGTETERRISGIPVPVGHETVRLPKRTARRWRRYRRTVRSRAGSTPRRGADGDAGYRVSRCACSSNGYALAKGTSFGPYSTEWDGPIILQTTPLLVLLSAPFGRERCGGCERTKILPKIFFRALQLFCRDAC